MNLDDQDSELETDDRAALKPLFAATAAARIADRFVTSIALGHFEVGSRLPTVKELAQLLAVSPTTVREAVAMLADLGYVVARRGRHGGTFVTSQWGPASETMVRRAVGSIRELEVTFDLRLLVEQLIARTAAERHTAEDDERIRRAAEAYVGADRDRETSRLADLEVHQAISDATHNAQLADLSLRIRRDIALGFDPEPYNPDVRQHAVDQHFALAEAVIGSRADAAAAIAADHFAFPVERLRELEQRISPATADGRADDRTGPSGGAPRA